MNPFTRRSLEGGGDRNTRLKSRIKNVTVRRKNPMNARIAQRRSLFFFICGLKRYARKIATAPKAAAIKATLPVEGAGGPKSAMKSKSGTAVRKPKRPGILLIVSMILRNFSIWLHGLFQYQSF